MEEAENLCQKIAIMKSGVLMCLGNPLHLKNLYGSGFKLFLNCEHDKILLISEFIEGLLPIKWKKDCFAAKITYHFISSEGIIQNLFIQIELQKLALGIKDWGVSQNSLEDVFLNIIA